MCSTWQLSVPLNGLTCSDQRQPGSNVPRPILCPFKSTSSTFPLPSLNSRTSSGEPKPLPLISAIDLSLPLCVGQGDATTSRAGRASPRAIEPGQQAEDRY